MFNSFISVKVFYFQYTIQYTYKIKTISRQKFSKVKDCRSEKNVTQLNLGNKQCACNAITHRKLPKLYVISFARIYAAAIDQCNAWDPYIHRKIMCKCVATKSHSFYAARSKNNAWHETYHFRGFEPQPRRFFFF